MGDKPTSITFPTEGILPKTETGAAQFVEKYPTWDGRGVVVAIFDTGVDPGAAGLQITSDGKPKIIDVVDCTGSGDIEMSEVREIKQGDTSIVGLSGRTLKIGKWSCPSGKVFLGIKRVYELFPRGLVKRVKEERLESFTESHRSAESVIQQKLNALEQQESNKTEAYKREKKDIEALISALAEQMEQYSDSGPAIDCLVFFDGSKWRAVVDSNCSGDLTSAQLLTNFRDERQFSTFREIPGTKPNSVLLNFAVNIYEDGKRLSIVVDAGSHGTHVAGIVAANYPDKPALNGIAPGAQIVSCKIGDTRLGSMETGAGLVRGLLVAKENNCDLINLSYGESYLYPNVGRFVELASEFVNRHNIIFVSSAGNNGPALSTVGAPGGTTSAIIGVGAYVSPGMMEVEYSSLEPLRTGTNYTWSSRGPAIDGHMGVSVCAPGGAIAPVPTWTLQNKELMNGTSMSSPNCCGGIALLLSALKATGTAYSPHSVRRAIENTAAQVEGIEPFALGHGLLQIPHAFDYLKQFESHVGAHVPISATLSTGQRGVYLRSAAESERAATFQVKAIPQFHRDCDNADVVAFELDVALAATVPWVRAPRQVVLNGQGGVHASKGFDVAVDAAAAALAPGAAHFGLVQGFDAAAPGRGPLFHLPVTVIKPKRVPDDGEFRLQILGRTYAPGCIDRHFVHVPEGATCARFTFRTGELAGPHMLVLHALQLLPEVAATGRNPHELDRYIRLKPHHEVVEHLAVRGGVTLEVCLCKFWSSVGSCAADVEVEFHGVALGARTLTVTPAGPEPLEIATPLRAETLAVTARATRVRRLLAPTKAAIRALDPARHLLPRGRQVYELELHYAFEQGEKEAVKCQPGVPGLSELLYDSPLEAQMWMVFDANKQLMGAGDALHDYPVTLPKGKYTARLSLRHDQRDALDKLKGTLMAVDFALAKEVSLGVYASLHAAVSGGAKYSGGAAAAGGRVVVYVAPPTDKAAGAKPGDLLLGAVTAATLGEYRAECALRCVVGKEEEAEDDKDEPARTDDELLADALRDARLGRLKKLREEKKWEAFDKLAAAAAAEHPAHLPLLREVLAREGADGGDAQDPPRRRARCAAAVRAARAVVAACDPAGLAAHYGLRHDGDDAAQKAARKDADARKEALVEAALARAERLAELLEPAPGRAAADGGGGLEAGGPGVIEELGEAWGLVRQWVVPKEAKPDVQARYAHAASFSAIQA